MIDRECRRLTLPPQRSQQKQLPSRELFADFDPWSMHTTATTSQKKPLLAYRGRDIVKENKRQQICYRARASPVREV
ncbi:unnamed protein product [Anisakis simplex]|uniref:Uncharacterized protein n=1 Tax=Anisakis simplex TaxID=6269 RepID=A0A0M3JB29_ANISI|nr:unnamed protein product [Anisakis simplex]